MDVYVCYFFPRPVELCMMECMCAQIRPQKSLGGTESAFMFTQSEKSSLQEAHRRVGPMTLYHAGRAVQHTTD